MSQYLSIHGVKKIRTQTYVLSDSEHTEVYRCTIIDKFGNETEISCFMESEETEVE